MSRRQPMPPPVLPRRSTTRRVHSSSEIARLMSRATSIGTKTFDALIFGYYEGNRLTYAARTRNGFTPVVRQQLFKKFRGLEIKHCPFENLPEAKSGRWGADLTAAKMKDCRWLKPVLVAQIEFLEWTGENHLRHTKFIALRDDKPARKVGRE